MKYIYSNLPRSKQASSAIHYALNRDTADVIIIGASTAERHYSSNLIGDVLGKSVYNLGSGGMDITYSDIVLSSLLDRCHPSIVVLDLSHPDQLSGNWGNRNAVFLPFYGLSQEVTNYYDEESDWQMKCKLNSSLYRYNKQLGELLRIYYFKESDIDSLKGYKPLRGVSQGETLVKNKSFTITAEKEKHLNNILNSCKGKNVELFISISPAFEQNPFFEDYVRSYAKDNHIALIDERTNAYYYNNISLFRDHNHLNKEGAEYFSSKVASQIKKAIDNQSLSPN